MSRRFLFHDPKQGWIDFKDLERTWCVYEPSAIRETIAEIEKTVNETGYVAAGWLSYEAASGFDPILETHQNSQFPLLWFALYRQYDCISHFEKAQPSNPIHWALNKTQADYSKAIDEIKWQIRQGNTYQVNYTLRQYADLDGDPWQLFLNTAANARYGAYIDNGQYVISSASPELFFRLEGEDIHTRPMKGTRPRGLHSKQDQALKEQLKSAPKDQAENLMILDMIRNDLGRIAIPGSVQVPQLFEIEQYPSVWQMTSTVKAQTHCNVASILDALFPCASITGAPKAQTMKIIKQLEPTPRKLYTGSIGYIAPDHHDEARHAGNNNLNNNDQRALSRSLFNVAIRTTLIDKQYAQAEYGVGGGIVWDSNAIDEYQECLTKSKVLFQRGEYQHQLLETLLWQAEGGYFLLDYHLERLKQSAYYFDYRCDILAVEQALIQNAQSFTDKKRVRLLLHKNGDVDIAGVNLPAPLERPYRVKLAQTPVDKNTVYLYHKTTQRAVYDDHRQLVADYDDVLLFNVQGEVTESCIANVIYQVDDQWFTPPISSGLLAGTYRQYMLDKGLMLERILLVTELKNIDKIALINSVRGQFDIDLTL